ncbi:hypothetical protein Mal15_32690 [Stieleria maiorica]|uniref:Caspase domain protein n=1 Tax=Stieleria maiorica TaxID=2795974 RepID=A0A5B9MDP6_9BACT|nr:hypothetical protein [Stieleria maiorica]QEF99208.1 hypothetical protein Mal15_32690 [Stieleria maiorica]
MSSVCKLIAFWVLIGGAFGSAVDGAEETAPLDVLVVVGAPGEDEFGEAFAQWAATWEATCQRADLVMHVIGPTGDDRETSDKDQLKAALSDAASTNSARPLWLILIGHGTWDGASADFNLVGPDVNAKEISEWLDPIRRPLVIANCASSSGPFINRLSGENRVIVTATKSGSEQNYARFGEHFAAAFSAADADLDHDDSVSVREAFLKATVDVDRFYQEQGRLATEHALLDDNGDRKGSSLSLVLGKATSKGDAAVDGELASRFSLPVVDSGIQLTERQLKMRDDLESQLRQLRDRFSGSERGQLRERALPLLLKLAGLYTSTEGQRNDHSTVAP